MSERTVREVGLASPAAADLRIVPTEGSSIQGDASAMPDAMRKAFGQNASKQVTLWIGDDRSARVDDDVTMILRLDREEIVGEPLPQRVGDGGSAPPRSSLQGEAERPA